MAGKGKKFNDQIDAWAKAFPEKMGGLARQAVMELCERVVVATPVDTGFLRSSWQPSLNGRQDGHGQVLGSGGSGADAAAALAMAQVSLTAASLQPGDTFHMTNNANYAYFVEYGTSKMAPRFFMTDNLKQWPSILEKTAKELGLK